MQQVRNCFDQRVFDKENLVVSISLLRLFSNGLAIIKVDPTGLENPKYPVPDYTVKGIRGGHAKSYLLDTRSASRATVGPDARVVIIGIRLVLSEVP